MSLQRELTALLGKEITLEWRNRYAVNGILIYVISTVFISYLCFKKAIDVPVWNALFWIIMLFAAVNAVAKSFIAESKGRLLYYYSLCDPRAVILAKSVYNVILLSALGLINFIFFFLFLGSPVVDYGVFLSAIVLGCTGFALIMTMVSAIAARAHDNATLMAILTFPVIIPLILTVIKLSSYALEGGPIADSITQYIVLLSAINLLVLALAYILFPYLWHD